MLSKSSIYGIRSMIYIAVQQKTDFISTRDITRDLDISFSFVSKIFQRLSKNRLILSSRGAGGGIRIAKALDNITILDIIESIEENPFLEGCVLGLGGCGTEKPCPLHEQWAKSSTEIKDSLKSMTLEKLAAEYAKGNFRLSDINEVKIINN